MGRKSLGRAATFLWLGAVALGCGEQVERDAVVPLDQVPPTVMKVAKAKLPGITFQTAWKVKAEGKEAYEVRGQTKKGQTRDIMIAADGQVLEVD
jgi:hypothetical protein